LLQATNALRDLCSLLEQSTQLQLRLLYYGLHVAIVSIRIARCCLARICFLVHGV